MVSDEWLYENGYMKKCDDGTTIGLPKMTKALETIFKVMDCKKYMISPELFMAYDNGEVVYVNPVVEKVIRTRPKKITPEGYLTTKEKKAIIAQRKAREAKYGRNVYRKTK